MWDEGASTVVERVVDRAGIETLVAETMTVEERHPYPRGELPHNPRHRVVFTKAMLEVPLSGAVFEGLGFRPVRSEPAVAGEDYIVRLAGAARTRGARVLPWVKAVNGAFEGDAPVQRTLTGVPVSTWLCPTRPETRTYLIRLVEGILDHYGEDALLLDRLRYPDWSGAEVRPERLLTCFCDACIREMSRAGIDVSRLAERLAPLARGSGDPGALAAFLDAVRGEGREPEIRAWLAFRKAAITGLAQHLRRALDARRIKTTLWLNLWPPSFGWLLGQDMRALAPFCDGAKIFPYHRLGGGADLAGLVQAGSDRGRLRGGEEAFRALVRAFDLPYELSFEAFQAHGFPIDFVGRETRKAAQALGPGKPVFAGIQIWETPGEEIEAACQVARDEGADGFFFYCYGWASLEALDTVGRVVRSLR